MGSVRATPDRAPPPASCADESGRRLRADAPPSPLHREPVFDVLTVSVAAEPERYPFWADQLPSYAPGTCPVWEALQPRVMLLKTNYFDVERYEAQAAALQATIEWFEKDRGEFDPDGERQDGGPMALEGNLV